MSPARALQGSGRSGMALPPTPCHLPCLSLQPATDAELATAMELLPAEISQHADIVIVPGGWAGTPAQQGTQCGCMLCMRAHSSTPMARILCPRSQRFSPGHLPPPPVPLPHAGADLYRALPSKTLQLLSYAVSSSCAFTHVMKADDDVHIRPQVRGRSAGCKALTAGVPGPAAPSVPSRCLTHTHLALPCAAAHGHHRQRAVRLQRGGAVRQLGWL